MDHIFLSDQKKIHNAIFEIQLLEMLKFFETERELKNKEVIKIMIENVIKSNINIFIELVKLNINNVENRKHILQVLKDTTTRTNKIEYLNVEINDIIHYINVCCCLTKKEQNVKIKLLLKSAIKLGNILNFFGIDKYNINTILAEYI